LKALEEMVSLHIQNLEEFLLSTLSRWTPTGLNWHDDTA